MRQPMGADKEAPSEPFKRALTLAMRTIAREPALQVSFGGDAPALSGTKARLPQVDRDLDPRNIAVTRGVADAFSLRLANHDDAIHGRYRPEGRNAQAVFEAVEQARVEAIGARDMRGM